MQQWFIASFYFTCNFSVGTHAFIFCFCRLHGVKIEHRKAENQIKMAKMIMMNELNKRANLLIEQLEVVSFSFILTNEVAAKLQAWNQ